MSKRSPVVVVALSVTFCFLSGSIGLRAIGCCLGSPLHSFSTSSTSSTVTPSELRENEVDLLPSVVWPWIASAKHLALTFGARFVVTFDGRLYRLSKSVSPDCRHTLMRDRSSDRISTLIGNLRTLTIIAKQMTISIDENYQVKVNNTNLIRDLPLTSWDRRILVSREGSWISVESFDGGYMATCSPLAKICMVILSTNYEGHSAGLLGTNDGNSSNDFILRNGRESENMRNFINSYEVTGMAHCLNSSTEDNSSGRQFRAGNDAADADGEEEEEEDDEGTTQEQEEEDERMTCEKKYVSACRALFRSQRSTLAECFSKIDSVPFLNACLDLMDGCSRPQHSRQMTNVTDTGLCSLVFSYSLMCSLRPTDSCASGNNTSSSSSNRSSRDDNGFQILQRIPTGCRGCSASSTDIAAEQSLQPTRRKVDIIFVVSGLRSSNETNAYRIGQTLRHLLHELRESLRTDHGIHDLRIGLVTHDDNARPISHTLKGQLFGTSHSHSSLESRLVNLDTTPGSPSFPASAASAASVDPQLYTTRDALRLALRYPMRTLAVKQFLLVSTSANHSETDDLEHISRELIRRGIQLNLWSPSGAQSNSSSLRSLVDSTGGSLFRLTRTTHQSSGTAFRQISRRLVQQIVSRMRQCQRCSATCSLLGTLDDQHCRPVEGGPC